MICPDCGARMVGRTAAMPYRTPAHVDIDHVIRVIDADGIHRRQRYHAGVVDQDFDAPVAFECAGREGVHAPGVGHVQLGVLGLVASLG